MASSSNALTEPREGEGDSVFHVKRMTVAILAAVALLVVGLTWSCARLYNSVDTYEQRYTDCMEVAKSWLPNHHLEYPSKSYDDITRACEEQANRGG